MYWIRASTLHVLGLWVFWFFKRRLVGVPVIHVCMFSSVSYLWVDYSMRFFGHVWVWIFFSFGMLFMYIRGQ